MPDSPKGVGRTCRSTLLLAVLGEADGPPLDGGIRTGFMTFDYEPFTFTFTSNGELLVWSFGKKVVVWQVDSREILLKQEADEIKAGVSVAPGGRFAVDVAPAQP